MMPRSYIPRRLRPIVATIAGIAAGTEVLPLPIWARMIIAGAIAIAAAEGITPSSTAAATITQAAKDQGPWT